MKDILVSVVMGTYNRGLTNIKQRHEEMARVRLQLRTLARGGGIFDR